ncbi:MAG TPA: MazG nucleotide pyrophosphohydrolase domain-containing protein [Promineifilum sp.]|nr:MazG nucleotide pyrophosphohydrolase domain-containing protein [Promineifilum sp.]
MTKDVMPYCIGSNVWNGLSKLNEEMGEVQQVIGKIIGNEGRLDHWDGSNLRERLQDEIADVLAAIKFVANKNALTWSKIDRRADAKYAVFCNWHDNTSRRGTGETGKP